MRVGGGHGKGAGFERDIAKAISTAFKCFKMEKRDCWRSVLSGGHDTSSGDLRMSDRLLALFPYSVECKFHKKIDWPRLFIPIYRRKKSWKEFQWMEQAKEGAKKMKGLEPLLVVKENHGEVFAFAPWNGFGEAKIVDSSGSFWQVLPFNDFLKRAVLVGKQKQKYSD